MSLSILRLSLVIFALFSLLVLGTYVFNHISTWVSLGMVLVEFVGFLLLWDSIENFIKGTKNEKN